MGTEGSAVVVITALEAGEGEFVIVSVADADGAQGMQVGVDVGGGCHRSLRRHRRGTRRS